ncbi:hypothetical protein TRIATDRAFT_211944 [Trichoderma atroviride IMI 206040]|uniref:Uncharacterized protein n=1 Tax=Hypocrea atroviridis (strain ATCC 20476 / IMI 206040) TaxID=452589 RepID=G9NGP9_HYPAI|nr:uncharacterized protein TRIATDRAFT_211944 [Trichoderma atroviride IMI 206040]EHK50460.1 hypothetical protein TRIATDRAFT_211944 [Trichoderma atroviride IMI 206040]
MSFLHFIRAQYKTLPLTLAPADCQGHTYIVTGANSGIGYECVKHLARLGSSRVILGVRSRDKGEAAKKAIEVDTGCDTNILQVWEVDLGSYESVAAFAKKAGEELHRIDGIVENAGTAEGSWVEKEGKETNMTVNVFSTFLMALLVLPHLHKSARQFGIVPQLVIIGSGLAFQAKPIWEKLDIGNIFGDLRDRKKYPLSKLLLTFAYFEFARRAPFSRTGVAITMVNPGACKTNLASHLNSSARLQIGIVLSLIGRNAEMGSRTLLHGLAVGEEAHGRYLSECEISDHIVPDWVTDDDGREWQVRVWEDIAAELEKACPGCLDVISNE